MSQQSGHHRSKSQTKNSYDSKLQKDNNKSHTKLKVLKNSSRRVSSKEEIYGKSDEDDKQYAINYGVRQPTENTEVVSRKSKELHSRQVNKNPKLLANIKHTNLNPSKRNLTVSTQNSKQNAHSAISKQSKAVKGVKHSGRNDNERNNLLSSVEFCYEKQEGSVDYQDNKNKQENDDTFSEQPVGEEIHSTGESDHYSSDFSEEDPSVSSQVLQTETKAPSNDYKSNNDAGEILSKSEPLISGICESVSTMQRNDYVDPTHRNTVWNDGKSNNVINFEQSNRLLIHQHISSRVKRRAKDLSKLIDLSLDELIHVFELKPMDQYEFHMLHSNEHKNRSHCQVQTNDDALDREVQTEPIDICSDNFSTNVFYDSCFLSDRNSESSQVILDELARELCLGINASNDTNIQNTDLSVHTHNLTANSELGMTNKSDPLPSSFAENVHLILDILEEENSYSPKKIAKNGKELEMDGSFVEISFRPTADHFSEEYNGINSVGDSRNGNYDEDTYPTNLNGFSQYHNISSFWDHYECIACECAPQNQSVIMTVHRPIELNQGKEDLKNPFNYQRRAGEFICIWTAIGVKQLPDRLLYCPGLSETGLKGANLNCAMFSPDTDASLLN
ncbi:unnamed protein product [Trichobilharzia regenti]|nr:unnamed protein product [Trichobilharzia regenti]